MKFLENFLFILSLIVIICLCYFTSFNTFQTDDYGFAGKTNNIGIFAHITELYFNWGGRFFSYSLNTLNPAGNLYLNWVPKLFPIFLWASLIVGFYLNLRRYFHLNLVKALKKSSVAFLFYTIILASISEHYFWITGAIVYFLPHVFALFFIYIIGIRNPKLYHQIIKYLLIVLIMGSNEIIALFLLLFLSFELYKNHSKKSIVEFSTGLIFFCIIFFAPGNFIRMSPSEDAFVLRVLKKIGIAFANGGYISLKIGLIMPLFIGIFHAEILKINYKISLKDRWNYQIILVIVLTFSGIIMLASERSLETILIYSLLSTSILIVYYFPKIKKLWMFSLASIFIPSIMLFPYKIIYFNLNYNLYNIAKELYFNNLKDFENEIFERHETLRDSKDDKVVLKRVRNIPKILYFDELGNAKNRNYVNQQLEVFYHKKSIVRE